MFFSENILHTFSVLFLTHFQGHVQKKGIANDRMIVRNFLSHPSLNRVTVVSTVITVFSLRVRF